MVGDLLADTSTLPGDTEEIPLSQDHIVSADTIPDSSDHSLVGRVYLPVLFQNQAELISEEGVNLLNRSMELLFIPTCYDDIVGISSLMGDTIKAHDKTVNRFKVEVSSPL